jgi:L-threonylcarbamoyladenylate synthase
MAECVSFVNKHATLLFKEFWPGPLSVILPKKKVVPSNVCAGLNTVAVRSPAHKQFRAVLKMVDAPIAAPSANKSNKVSPTLASHLLSNFGSQCPPVLDGGPCNFGLESTVLDLSVDVPVILRPGPISQKDVEQCLKTQVLLQENLIKSGNQPLKSPGQTQNHYSPKTPIFLTESFTDLQNTPLIKNSDVILCLNTVEENYFKNRCLSTIRLSRHGESYEIAHNLYDSLQKADKLGKSRILVHRIEQPDALGIAINDRLTRASS